MHSELTGIKAIFTLVKFIRKDLSQAGYVYNTIISQIIALPSLR